MTRLEEMREKLDALWPRLDAVHMLLRREMKPIVDTLFAWNDTLNSNNVALEKENSDLKEKVDNLNERINQLLSSNSIQK